MLRNMMIVSQTTDNINQAIDKKNNLKLVIYS